MAKKVNKKELAEIIGKNETTITQYQKAGLPIERKAGRGASNTYDTAHVIDWLIQYSISLHGEDDDGRVYVYDLERARLTHHQANIAKMEEGLKKGDLITMQDAINNEVTRVRAMRSLLLALPTKLAPIAMQAQSLSEVKDFLTEEIHYALNELSDCIDAIPIDTETDKTDDSSGAQAAA